MSSIDLFAIQRRINNATPAPWHVEYGDAGKRSNTRVVAPNHKLSISHGTKIVSPAHQIATIWNVTCTCIQGHQYDNQEFIAHSITDMQDLIDEVKRLTKRVDNE